MTRLIFSFFLVQKAHGCQFILVVYKRLSLIFLAPCILKSGILEQSCGVMEWSGVSFGVEYLGYLMHILAQNILNI